MATAQAIVEAKGQRTAGPDGTEYDESGKWHADSRFIPSFLPFPSTYLAPVVAFMSSS
jgi:hypothetical protein